ncbi:MAG: glutamate--tRNA ligase, partial [Proteobacteria bacterium]|nr:glutamate--tRNA ligase [Pseudomonadota bacterium]
LFIMVSRPIFPDETSAASLSSVFIGILRELTPQLRNGKWDKENLERILTTCAEHHGIGFGKLAAPLRAALAGRSVTPSVYDMMLVLGRDETIARLADVCIPKP